MLWHYVQQAGPLGYVLVGVSIASVTVILERCWFWLVHGRPVSTSKRARWLDGCRNGDELMLDSASPESRALAYIRAEAALRDDGPLDVALSREIRKTTHGLSVLECNAAIAPMLGILGTIIGIIQAFAGMQGSVPDTAVMVTGISVAMLTTAIGLVVALISIIPFSAFSQLAYRRQVQTAELLREAAVLLRSNANNGNRK